MSEQIYPSYLIHYGIEGQKWGVRRFQNEDGTYTDSGLLRRKEQQHFVKEQKKVNRKFDKLTELSKSFLLSSLFVINSFGFNLFKNFSHFFIDKFIKDKFI